MGSNFKKSKYILLILILFLLGIAISIFFNDDFSILKSSPFEKEKINLLIVGYDSKINGPSRADTIILASFNIDTKEAGIIFIPRDTRVQIPERGLRKINSSHAYGGITLTRETVEGFLDIPIDYYVETDFKGFENIIDLLGGVEINIEKHLNYVDKAGGLYINLKPGRQNLSGSEALQYVRYRDVQMGDIGRVGRQQKFLNAVIKKATSPAVITKLPGIVKELNESVETNIPLQDINPFLSLAKEIDINNIKIEMLPGEPKYISGVSYWLPDKEEADIMVNSLIRDKSYIRNSSYTLSIFNGNGVPGMAGNLAEKLEKYGFEVNRTSNADNFNYTETEIIYYSKEDRDTAEGIQELINGKIQLKSEKESGIDIIIGSDYLQLIEEEKNE